MYQSQVLWELQEHPWVTPLLSLSSPFYHPSKYIPAASGQQEQPMPTVRHWLLSMCSMEWKSTKLPVTARSCKVTAVWLAMLHGGGEEARRGVWVLKVPHAGPLLFGCLGECSPSFCVSVA